MTSTNPALEGASTGLPHTTTVLNYSFNANNCILHDVLIEKWFEFDTYQLSRVIFTWVVFLLSFIGNLFVLVSLRRKQLPHFIMFHLAMADLIYTCSVLPIDAIWNTTMQWYSGNIVCKISQMWKQFGMYSSSFMVIVLEVDRAATILNSPSTNQQRKFAIILVTMAWICSALCCIPAGVLFSIINIPTCEGIIATQCVDNQIIPQESLRSYYFFTMFISFILPFITTIVSYSLIVCEITKMKRRDRQIMGRRKSLNAASIQRAINRTKLMRTLISLTFSLCWGPYYAKGVVDWFGPHLVRNDSSFSKISYLFMYLNSFLHSIVFGVFLREVRSNFYACFCWICLVRGDERIPVNKKSRSSVASLMTNSTHVNTSAAVSNQESDIRLLQLNNPVKSLCERLRTEGKTSDEKQFDDTNL